MIEGHCLCGSVRLRVDGHAAAVSVCHCSMCRRWSGLALAVFVARAGTVDVQGPVKVCRASSFAERAWCDCCGTHLWIRDDGGDYDLMPGLFDAARDFALVREVYADRAFAAARFDGAHARVTAAQYEATHAFVEGTR